MQKRQVPSVSIRQNSASWTAVSIGALAVAFCLSSALHAQTSDATSVSLKAHPGWMHVLGALIRPDCVHTISNGATVGDNGDVTLAGVIVAHYDACPEHAIHTRPRFGVTPEFVDAPGTGNGWVEAVQAEVSLGSGDDIDYLGSMWTVPSNPIENGGLIFIWNGIEPTGGNAVMQPVLQWGGTTAEGSPDGNIGGNYWTIATWFETPGGVFYHSPGVQVYAGDQIEGFVFITSESGGTVNWTGYIADTTNHTWSTQNYYTSGLQWSWAFAGVLEAYNITSCTEFPVGTAVFENNTVDHGYPSRIFAKPSWYGAQYKYGGPSCGFAAFRGSGDANWLVW